MTTKNKPQLSIVIPAYNEERYLPKLLKSIKGQNFKNYEIIVADAKSKDKTRQIAKKFGCKVVAGGLPGIGRNRGAEKAKGGLILFLDADVILPENFLENAINEFEKRNLDIAHCNPLPIEKTLKNRIGIGAANAFNSVAQYIKPFGAGFCIFVTKEIHKKINGFNEKIPYLEDIDYFQKASKIGKFRILKQKINVSMRRFVNEGWFYSFYRYFNAYVYMLRGKELTAKIAKRKKFRYSFDYKK